MEPSEVKAAEAVPAAEAATGHTGNGAPVKEPEPQQPEVREPGPEPPPAEPPGPDPDPVEPPGPDPKPVRTPPTLPDELLQSEQPAVEASDQPAPLPEPVPEPEPDPDPEPHPDPVIAGSPTPPPVPMPDPEPLPAPVPVPDPEPIHDPIPVPGEPPVGESPEMEAQEAMGSDQFFGGQEQPATADDDASLKSVLEAVIYVTDEPLGLNQIAAALEQPVERVRTVLEALMADYARADRGLTIREVAGGYKMTTKAEHHEAVRTFVKNLKPPLKLSLAALETLAVIAYKQPITAPEIMEIRGVQGAGVLKTLLDRKLITTAGRKNVIGKPILYKTTKDFLLQFGLKDLAELPTLKEFEELRRLALSDAEPDAPETLTAAAAVSEVAPAVESGIEQEEQAVAESESAEKPADQAEPPDA